MHPSPDTTVSGRDARRQDEQPQDHLAADGNEAATEREMHACGDCVYFVRDGRCGFTDSPEGRAKDRPFAHAPFWVWSDCYSDKEQVRANVKTMCVTFVAKSGAAA
jgi:hypothetical protein